MPCLSSPVVLLAELKSCAAYSLRAAAGSGDLAELKKVKHVHRPTTSSPAVLLGFVDIIHVPLYPSAQLLALEVWDIGIYLLTELQRQNIIENLTQFAPDPPLLFPVPGGVLMDQHRRRRAAVQARAMNAFSFRGGASGKFSAARLAAKKGHWQAPLWLQKVHHLLGSAVYGLVTNYIYSQVSYEPPLDAPLTPPPPPSFSFHRSVAGPGLRKGGKGLHPSSAFPHTDHVPPLFPSLPLTSAAHGGARVDLHLAHLLPLLHVARERAA